MHDLVGLLSTYHGLAPARQPLLSAAAEFGLPSLMCQQENLWMRFWSLGALKMLRYDMPGGSHLLGRSLLIVVLQVPQHRRPGRMPWC